MVPRIEDVISVIRPIRRQSAPPRRRRWDVRAMLVLAGGAAAAVSGRAWWAAAGVRAARGRVAAALGRAVGCEAKVGLVTAGWLDGIVIRAISIADPHGGAPLVGVDEVRADLSPIRLAFGMGLRRLELIGPSIRAEID